MSEETSPSRILAAFFERVGANPLCPSCGQNVWSVVDEKGVIPVLTFARRDGAYPIPPPATGLYVMVCTNCGFVRAHSSLIVEGNGGSLQDSRPENESEDAS